MIEQQKRVEVVERTRADASFEPNTGALDNGLRFNDPQDFSWRRAHFGSFLLSDVQLTASKVHIESRSN
jgi:hypothetical protein